MPLGCIYWPGWGIAPPGSFAYGLCIHHLLHSLMERAIIHLRLYDSDIDDMKDLADPSLCLTILDENGIDEINDDGCTLLSTAVRNRYSSIVEFLISAGADVNAKDNDGNTVLDNMKSHINLGITPRSVEALLRSHGARSGSEQK
jgi:hypothetical protein